MKKITLLSILMMLVFIFKTSAASDLPLTGTLSPTIPTDWTYITNDPAFPNPSFYTTVGAPGLKLSFENSGITSPEFNPQQSITVTLNVNVLKTPFTVWILMQVLSISPN